MYKNTPFRGRDVKKIGRGWGTASSHSGIEKGLFPTLHYIPHACLDSTACIKALAVFEQFEHCFKLSCIKPNTHRRRRRDSTVESRRVGVGGVYWIRNYRLAHDDCRRIRSTIWKLNIAVWLRGFRSILVTFSTMTSLCRHLSPTSIA